MSDKEKIEELGGSTALAEKIGYSVQRVQNWKVRGIPSKEKLKFPEIFLDTRNTKSKTLTA
ncbi:YdaS family helix-turn-helix protein [Acinetobacter bereziniae]|uniref:YdaS family helix-turn-helix protein n=1 Tax=Acinetobacter bereziniae TaxID=106648 RepID=UPI003AB6B5B8